MPRGTPSTQINVTVGSGGLSDKAKQLQTAARQGQLEKERQQRVEAEGTEQRNSKLKAEGKAPDGSPLYSVPFNQPQIDRRPAANRQGDALPYFYWKAAFNSEAERTEYTLKSGDGVASSTYTPTTKDLQFAIRDQLAPLAQTLPIDASWSVSDPTNYTGTEATRTTIVLQTSPARYLITIEGYQAERDISVLSAEREFLLPMGDDTALFIAYRQEAGKSSRREYYYRLYRTHFVGPFNSIGALITEELQAATYLNFEEISPRTVTDVGCFRIGHKVSSRVAVPTALSLAIDNLIPESEEITDTYTAYLPDCGAPSGGCIGFPPSGEITVDTRPLAWVNQEDYGVQSGIPRNLGYGITYQGSIPDFQCSPAAWFAISDKNNDKIFSYGNHINIETPLQPISGASFVSLFTPGKYIGLPTEIKGAFGVEYALDLSLASSPRPLKYSSSEYMSGSVYSEAYPYTLPAWRTSALKIPSSAAVNPTPDQFWRRSFIYDWGQPGFCRQQKSLYGITYTPFES